jgi:hypothetical protein
MTPSVSPFTLPADGEVFISEILQRSEDLIDAGVWAGLSHVGLQTWLQNFVSSVERYFAACVLDALIYRSDQQTIAMMEQMLDRVMPDLIRIYPPSTAPQHDWGRLLQRSKKRSDPRIRLIPVIRTEDPPTKSGPLIARMYRRHLHLDDSWMIWPWQMKLAVADGVTAVVFIDDFLGTGSQFSRFVKQFEITAELKNVYAVYAPLVAHRTGVERLAAEFPSIRVCAVEILDSQYGLFSAESMYFKDGINSPASAHHFYEELIAERLPEINTRYRTGFGGLELAYSFQHATPNNCLPILWHQSDKWTPLFER